MQQPGEDLWGNSATLLSSTAWLRKAIALERDLYRGSDGTPSAQEDYRFERNMLIIIQSLVVLGVAVAFISRVM